MKRMKFTAQELYILAYAAGKNKMYGIPDGFAWLEDEEVPAARQQVVDTLLEEGVLNMDFDGKLLVSSEYLDLVGVYCDCSKCLTSNSQNADGSSEDLIFWQYRGAFFRAEIEEDLYFFSGCTALEAEESLTRREWPGSPSQPEKETVIPRIALTKAKRYAGKGTADDALRILVQNGADERTAAVLCDGLQEKAQYVGLLLMDMSSGKCEKTERAFLSSRGATYALCSTVVNFRTCTVFTECSGIDAKKEIFGTVGLFLGAE